MKRHGAALGLLALGFALAGCATPRQQVATGLQSLGLPAQQAICMADSLDSRLSADQMRRVAKLVGGASRAGSGNVEPNRKNMKRAAGILIDAADPHIAAAASRAFVACTILGS